MGAIARPEPTVRVTDDALRVLQAANARALRFNGILTIGLWSDLDCPELRLALQLVGCGDVPVVHLDGPDARTIPLRYRVRTAPVKKTGVPFDKWKAAALNRMFQKQGKSGDPGKFTAEMIRRSETRDAAVSQPKKPA